MHGIDDSTVDAGCNTVCSEECAGSEKVNVSAVVTLMTPAQLSLRSYTDDVTLTRSDAVLRCRLVLVKVTLCKRREG